MKLVLTLAVAAIVSGCTAAPPRYSWGTYEDQIYIWYAKPGTLTPEAQADQMQKDRELAQAAVQPLPPGWRAHLGYIYFQMGRADLAREELLAEKAAFPESATLVDRLVTNLSAPPAKAP